MQLSGEDRISFTKEMILQIQKDTTSARSAFRLMHDAFPQKNQEELISSFDELYSNNTIFDKYILTVVEALGAEKEPSIQLLSEICKDQKLAKRIFKYISTKYKDSIDYFVANHTPATFPGGKKAWIYYLIDNLNHSVAIQNNAPSGRRYTVTVSFLIDKEGNISDANALADPGYGTVEEALRVIKASPKWIPATVYGQKVAFRQQQIINFLVLDLVQRVPPPDLIPPPRRIP